jgi:hypothetical protein
MLGQWEDRTMDPATQHIVLNFNSEIESAEFYWRTQRLRDQESVTCVSTSSLSIKSLTLFLKIWFQKIEFCKLHVWSNLNLNFTSYTKDFSTERIFFSGLLLSFYSHCKSPEKTTTSIEKSLGYTGRKVISNLTEEIQVSRRASDRGSYAKPLFVRALSSHSRV